MCTLHLKTPVSNFVMHKEFGEEDDKFQAHSQCFLKISKGWILPFFSQPKIDPRSQAKSNCTCSRKKTGISPVKLTVISMVGVHGIRLTSTLNEEGQSSKKAPQKRREKASDTKLPIFLINTHEMVQFYELHGWFKILPLIFVYTLENGDREPWRLPDWKDFEEENPSEPNLRFTRSMGPIIYLFRGEMGHSPKPRQSSRN